MNVYDKPSFLSHTLLKKKKNHYIYSFFNVTKESVSKKDFLLHK